MKLLLDAMYDPAVAEQLRRRGHDAIAASGHPDLGSLLDPDIFAVAQTEQRTVVTENVPDFLPLDALYRAQQRAHYGLILTTDRRFSRSSERHVGRLVLALDAFLRTQATKPQATSLIHWLQ